MNRKKRIKNKKIKSICRPMVLPPGTVGKNAYDNILNKIIFPIQAYPMPWGEKIGKYYTTAEEVTVEMLNYRLGISLLIQ